MTCPICGKEFKQTHGSQKICSDECKKGYQKEYQINYYNTKRKSIKPPKSCIICGREFIPWNKTQVTCGSKECKYAHNLSQKKKKKGAYLYAKNSGLPQTQPQVNKKYKKWEECTPAERWERMTWLELSAELIRMHITYGQAQVLKMQGRLPDDFGLGLRQQQDI